MRRALAGAWDGVVATGVMSAAMWGARRAGLLGKPPPRHLVERALGAAGLRRHTPEAAVNALSLLAHLGFGAAAGALFEAAGRTPRALPAAVALGCAYGGLVWAASYAGWIPALGLLAPPHRDRAGRPSAMLGSHLVFGAVLGARSRPARSP
ncbi:MAG: hypothetical protein QM704_22230 [Anaeromyxobacteraceae bacterium]